MYLSPVVLIAIAAAAVVYVINIIRNRLYHARKAKELGCEMPVRNLRRDPTGIHGLVLAIRADKRKEFLQFLQKDIEEVWKKRGAVTGTIVATNAFFRDVTITTDPQNIQAMLAHKFKEFSLGDNRIHNFQPLLGNGIFAADGKQWEHSRSLLRPQFVRSQISDLDLEENHVQSMMTVLDRHVGHGGWTDIVDLQVLFFRLTLDSATEFLFGESVDSQLVQADMKTASSSAIGKDIDFATAFDSSQDTLAKGGRLGPMFWLYHDKAFRENVRQVHTFIDHFVQSALARSRGEKSGSAGGGDDAEKQKYVFLHALAEQTQDPVELRSQLLNILLAGRDTTASTLGWFFYLVALPENEKVYQRLRTIILDEFGTYSNPKNITFETLKNCQYLQWCINETLRVYPIVPVNARTAVVDTCLPTGGGPDGKSPVYVKKGEDVLYSVHLMHRRKDLWGEDANEWKPDRWENRRPGWDYLPFNGGPRICIGQQFALTEIAYVLVRMIQRVDRIDGSQVGPIKDGVTLTNCPGHGVKVRVHFAE